MKRFLGLLIFILALNGCDDGDLTVDDIDFTSVSKAASCGDIVYKVKDSEALILAFPAAVTPLAFANEPTLLTPRMYDINTTNRVIYRGYDGVVTAASFCNQIPPTTPVVSEEWIATSGKIVITTIPLVTDNTDPDFDDGAQKIYGYRHTIIFKNVNFDKPDGSEFFKDSLELGNYDTTATTLPFAFDETLDKCSATNTLYNFTGRESLSLKIDPGLIVNEETLGGPRTGTLNATNVLTYKLYNADGALSPNLFCVTPTPTLPSALETWTGISGEIAVTTTVAANVYQHEIHLKNVILKKGNVEFKLANDYLFGIFTVNN